MKLSITTISFLIAGALTIALMAYVFEGAKPVQASAYTATVLQTATTSAATAVTTSARIFATTTNPLAPGTGSFTRVYATICNPNANPVALNLNGDQAANLPTGKATVMIAAAAGYDVCYEITDKNQYSGSVTASSTNQTSTTIFAQQFVQ